MKDAAKPRVGRVFIVKRRWRAIEPHWLVILANGNTSPWYTTRAFARIDAHELKRFGLCPAAIIKVTPK